MTELRTVTAVDVDPPKKQRRRPTPLTKRAMAECRKRGWIVESVEQTIRIPGGRTFKRDLFGCLDLLAITVAPAPRTIGIQVTSSANRAAHRTKIENEPRALTWLAAGHALELWTYRLGGKAGKRKVFVLTVERAMLDMYGDRPILWEEAA